jgi:hypothetical protein
MLLKVPCKFLILHWLQICQGSGVGSIPIGRSILFKQLRRRLIFHIFQNYNLIANLGGKCGLDLFHWNFTRIESRHRSTGVTHLLADDRRHYPGQLPTAVAASTEGEQPCFLQIECL